MTLLEFILKVTNRVAPFRSVSQAVVANACARRSISERLNKFYASRNIREQAVCHQLFAKLYRDGNDKVPSGSWSVKFNGNNVSIPLRSETAWLDWDSALSIVGHDADVKSTYLRLLESEDPPKVFFDVGANYGMHSLLFLTNGVRTISFEPNPACVEYFEAMCEANNVASEVEELALSNFEGETELFFPDRDTWLGTIVTDTADKLSDDFQLNKIKTKVSTMDGFVERSGIMPDLVKIDTEGNELNVLSGAKRTLQEFLPFVVFESNDPETRPQLFAFFEEAGYAVLELSVMGNGSRVLDRTQFESSTSHNFGGVSLSKLPGWI